MTNSENSGHREFADDGSKLSNNPEVAAMRFQALLLREEARNGGSRGNGWLYDKADSIDKAADDIEMRGFADDRDDRRTDC